ncbi:MAG: metallophosphoesterase [Deltaproteobacteria bacterium]|nr:metallophosphoesterase [Deltaproteobacteria bacterium]
MTRTAKRLLIAGAAVAVAMLVWNTICVYDVRLQYAEAPDDVARALRGTKIMFLSDIHVRSIGLRENQVLRMAEEIEPDFVLISGDLMPYGGTPDAAVEFFRLLKPTRAGYAILGDAEYKQGSRHCLFCHKPGEWSVRRDLPIRTIRDEVVTLEGPEGKVALWGADAVERPKDLEWATSPPREPGVPVIAMTHFPELAKKIRESRRRARPRRRHARRPGDRPPVFSTIFFCRPNARIIWPAASTWTAPCSGSPAASAGPSRRSATASRPR